MVWVMNGFTHASTQFLPTETDNSLKIAGVGDFNGDGNVDVYFHNSSTGGNSIWILDGNFQPLDDLRSGQQRRGYIDDRRPARGREPHRRGHAGHPAAQRQHTGQNQVWIDSSNVNVATLPDDTNLNDQIVGSQTL